MDLSSSHLAAFQEVARLLNFTQASKRLHLTQSALSQRVKNLESDLGLSLFIRAKEGVRLTEAGNELLRYCKAKKSLETEMLGRLRPGKSTELFGEVRIGGISSVAQSIIIPALAPLIRKHSDVGLSIKTAETFELLDLLKHGEIDYAISDQNVNHDDLVKIGLGVEEYVLVQKKNSRAPLVYLDHDELDATTRNYLRRSRKTEKDIRRFYLDDIHGVMTGLKADLGRAVLPKHFITGVAELEVLNSETMMDVPLFLYHYHQPFYSRLHDSVVKQIIKKFDTILKSRPT